MEKSETIGEISKALAKAQGEMSPAKFDATNPFFKSEYATLTSIMAACRDALSKNGIAIIQGSSVSDRALTVTTMLCHSSGEYISDSLTMTVTKTGPQDIGSAITYARRYSLSGMVGIVSDSDDDGESSKDNSVPKPTTAKKKTQDNPGAVAANQIKIARKMLTQVGCKSLGEMQNLVAAHIGRDLTGDEGLQNLSHNERSALIEKLDIQLKAGNPDA